MISCFTMNGTSIWGCALCTHNCVFSPVCSQTPFSYDKHPLRSKVSRQGQLSYCTPFRSNMCRGKGGCREIETIFDTLDGLSEKAGELRQHVGSNSEGRAQSWVEWYRSLYEAETKLRNDEFEPRVRPIQAQIWSCLRNGVKIDVN